MRASQTIALAFGVALAFTVPQKMCIAQGVTGSGDPQTGVALIKPAQPIYPAVARAARITGEVDLTVSVRQDGTVDSVVVASGHPLLRDSAVTSARQSQFECRGCTEQLNEYRMVYTFNIEGECGCEPREARLINKEPQQADPQILDSQHRVTVVAQPLCTCDPAAITKVRVRSAKCLYLWRCGSKIE